MKILFLSHGRTYEDQIGYREAFIKAKSEGVPVECIELPFLGYAEKHGWKGFYSEILRINDEWKPDVIFFQFFHGGKIYSPSCCITRLKKSKNIPVIIGSQGDLFDVKMLGAWRRRPEPAMIDLAVGADAFFSTSMGDFADFLAKKGVRNVIFLPHAFSAPHFNNIDMNRLQPKLQKIAMVGSIGLSYRRPLGTFFHAFNRISVAKALWKKYGNEFALYGNGWHHKACRGPIAFRDQVKVFRSSKCVVDSPPPINEVYYASDRPFFIAGSGAPLVQFYTPRFETVLRDGEHIHFVRKGESVCNVCKNILQISQEELDDIGMRTRAFIMERHTVENRVDTILSVVERLRGRSSQLRLWHFLPEINVESELKFAGRNLTIC